MYDVAAFREDRVEVMHALIQAHPLATLVTMTPQGLEANHIPFLIDAAPAPFGTLRGHVARANPVWRSFNAEVDVLAVFQGSQAYITPSWYPSKAQHGKVVRHGTTPWPTRRGRSRSWTTPSGCVRW